MTAELPIVTDPAPPKSIAGITLLPLHEKYTREGICKFRESGIPISSEWAFRKEWGANKREWMERGFGLRNHNGKWYLQQWLRVMPDGQLALTPIGASRLAELIKPAQSTLELPKPEAINLELPELPPEIAAKLFDYQVEPARQLLRALTKGAEEWGFPGAWDCSEMGVGKTYQALAAAIATGLEVGVVCPLAVIPAWGRAFQHFGQCPRFIRNYESLRTGRRDYVSLEEYTNENGKKAKRYRWNLEPKDTILIFDEAHTCFTGDTQVFTEAGEIPIAELVEQRLALKVWTLDEEAGYLTLRNVTGWFRNPMREVMVVHHEFGKIECTGDHRFYVVGKGWMHAENLLPGDELLALREELLSEDAFVPNMLQSQVRNDLPTGSHSTAHQAGYWRERRESRSLKNAKKTASMPGLSRVISAFKHFAEMLLAFMRNAAPHQRSRSIGELSDSLIKGKGEQSRRFDGDTQKVQRANEVIESNDESRSSQKNGAIPVWSHFYRARRKWQNHPTTRKARECAESSNGICDRHPSICSPTLSKSSQKLQSGHRGAESETGHRGGWQNSPSKKVAISRQTKNGHSRISRVERLEILESGDRQQLRAGNGKSALYDIEVAGTHCYFAGGVLVHNCRTIGSLNQGLLMAAARQRFPLICASGTLATDPTHMRATGRVVGLHQGGKDFQRFLLDHNCEGKDYTWKFKGGRHGRAALASIHRRVFPARGARVRIEDLGDRFPETQIMCETFDTGETQAIAKAFKEAEQILERMAAQGAPEWEIKMRRSSAYMEAWHNSERCKVPAIADMAEKEIEEGRSVAVFVNFTDVRESLMHRLKTRCAIYGGQAAFAREACIADFQADRARAIIANIDAGGVGVSLHDINGTHPRTAIILPTNKVVSLTQALGRVHRAGGKSRSRQIVFYAAGTVEEQICDVIRKRMAQISTLNDGELYPSDRF